jgi:DNA (cytosine-5)-methyltransferase 1
MSELRIGSTCTGYGGLDAAVQAVIGGELAWVADPDPGAAAILAHHHPDVPNLGDITTVTWEDVAPIDVLCGGYPCQPFSNAGLRKGVEDERHIWPYIADALRVLRPRYALFENVAGHLGRGFDVVLADLAALGFDAEWCTVRASEVGAPHRRERLFVLATLGDAPDILGQRAGGLDVAAQPDALGDAGRASEDADRSTGGERRVATPGQAESGRARADAGRRGGAPAADALGDGRHEGRPEPARLVGRPDAALSGLSAPADTDGSGRRPEPRQQCGERATERLTADIAWGDYGPAIRRWEHILGRPAPHPTQPGQGGKPRLSPLFTEWLMGLPAGHVTDVPGLSRNQQLKALGNGVVPAQAIAALELLMERRAAA